MGQLSDWWSLDKVNTAAIPHHWQTFNSRFLETVSF
jgi:hypothetical protein